MTILSGEDPRGETNLPTRGIEIAPGEQFMRGGLSDPISSERQLGIESERASQQVEESERSANAFSRGGGEEVSRDQSRRTVRHVKTDSSVADIFELPMREGLYGVTRMDTFPFKIMINSRQMRPRQLISLTHEMLHVWAKLHKMEDLPHDKLHDLAVFIFSEIVPVLNRFQERTK
jgi:hypothetical protein